VRLRQVAAWTTCLLIALGSGERASAARQQSVAFVNVNVVTMTDDQMSSGQTVVVIAGRITAIGPVASVRVPGGARQIDGTGKFLMPGLTDMHVHLIRDAGSIKESATPAASGTVRRIGAVSASLDHQSENHALGLLFVTNGVTAVRNMWGDAAVDAFARDIESGRALGPHIYSTGPITDGFPSGWVGSRVVQTQSEAEAAVEQDKRSGYVALKVYNGLSADAYHWLVAAARAHDLPVVGHVPDAVGLRGVIEARQDSIEHLDGFLEALQPDPSAAYRASWQELLDKADLSKLPALVESIRAAGIWNCPTLVLMQTFPAEARWQEQISSVPPALLERYRKMIPGWHANAELTRRNFLLNIALTRALHQGGARLLLGTDSPKLTVLPGYSLHEELVDLVQAGLTPYEAIRAGTSDAAIFLHREQEFGTLQVGLRADLLLLQANPLADVRNLSRRAGVMIGGRWFSEAALQHKLQNLRDSYH
jgi:imidazolonepropionase-like amidohydrolase